MAAVVALVLGGTQALSRSLFSQMIPKGGEGEYFSLYEISDKGTSWLARSCSVWPCSLPAVIAQRSVLADFFIAGLLILLRLTLQGDA